MKRFNKLTAAVATATTALIVAICAQGLASAAQPPCFQYDPSGNFTTSSTPVFNNICGDPTVIPSNDGTTVTLGDESNFVRIRPDTSGDDTSNANNPSLRDDVTSACNAGDKFDIWTYIHNDALSQDNDNGSGSAVAKNVKLTLTAKDLNKTQNHFDFSSTVSADNAAATVTDGAALDCNGQAVTLKLVPSSIKYTQSLTNPAYNGLPDSDMNNTFGIGNPVWPAAGQQGDQWGCYTYRIVVVYQVVVQPATPTVVQPVCTLLTMESSGSVAKIEGLDFTNGSTTTGTTVTAATVTGATLQFFNGSTLVNTATLTADQLAALKTSPYVFDFSSNSGTFKVVGTVNTSVGNTPPVAACEAVFTKTTPPTQPPVVLTSATPPKQLINTGPGSVAGIFAAATAVGAGAYRWFLSRRALRG